MKDRFRDFHWPHQVERPRTGWLSHFRWIAGMWLLLVFRDQVGLERATAVAFSYLEEALTDHPVNRILVDTRDGPITVTLPPYASEYRIKNLGPHPVTVEAPDAFSNLDVKGGSAVNVIKRQKSDWRVRR